MSDRPVVIRADAGPRTGAGHVMRCLALAQALAERGCPSVFLVPPTPSWITDRLRSEGFTVVSAPESPGGREDADRTASAATERRGRGIVLDGYRFGAAFQERVTATGIPTLAVDDNGELGTYEVDLVLNQNLHACASFYEHRRPDTKLLLGPRYALLRREFVGARDPEPTVGPGSLVLVALGGGEQRTALDLVTNALATIDDPAMEVLVVGDTNATTDPRITSVGHVADMPDRMRSADLAVASAGSISWELAYMGVPAVTIATEENQKALSKSLDEARVSTNVGALPAVDPEILARSVAELLHDPDRRLHMARRGCDLVDGLGADRVAAVLLDAERT